MNRLIVSHRCAGVTAERQAELRAAVGSLVADLGDRAVVVADSTGSGDVRRIVVLEMPASSMEEAVARAAADVMVEPEVLHQPGPTGPTAAQMPAMPGAGPAPGGTLTLEIRGDGAPLAGAEVLLLVTGSQPSQLEATADAAGRARFELPAGAAPAAAVAIPLEGYWDTVLPSPADGGVVDCARLPEGGPVAWWHRFSGVSQASLERGRGLRLAVVDTGVGPHPNLAQVQVLGAFEDGRRLTDGSDLESHGTHIAGIIGARPGARGQYTGLAPGAELFAVRAARRSTGAASQGDIAAAIDLLSREHQVDLVNVSLAAPSPSEILRDALADALDRGTLCICAAGNTAGSVQWPAAFDEAVAVAALGMVGWGPDNSLSRARTPQDTSRFTDNELYFANLSSFGDPVDASAPGVGVISTVPARAGAAAPYGVKDGTSVASPVVTAVLAARLAADPSYLELPRDRRRADAARAALQGISIDIGLARDLEGFGLPRLP